jgi:hypothetical protein
VNNDVVVEDDGFTHMFQDDFLANDDDAGITKDIFPEDEEAEEAIDNQSINECDDDATNRNETNDDDDGEDKDEEDEENADDLDKEEQQMSSSKQQYFQNQINY